MATAETPTCPVCGMSGTLQIGDIFDPDLIGTHSLAGGTVKVNARNRPELTCAACPLRVRGEYTGRHAWFPAVIDVPGGDILAAAVDAIVNPVNCVGVAGKGLALQFKQQYPRNFAVYRDACKKNALRPGKVLVVPIDGSRRHVINFPTKRHWHNPSRMQDIEEGLRDLAGRLPGLGIRSIAVPALGCGLGGLPWDDVRPRIVETLAPTKVHLLLYPPREQVDNARR